jgi:beta-mannosidase
LRDNIDLCDGWTFAWTGHQGRLDEPPPLNRATFRNATVPGDAHLDLMRQGLLPDLFVGMNLEQARWMEDKDWWYRTRFETPRLDGRRALLVFHGLDTFATVWLNGCRLGDSANMHRRITFDVTDRLREDGANELLVRLVAPRYAVDVDPDHKPLTWSPERLFCRKAQMSFGWDIAPRLLTVGIWRPVELVLVDRGRITDFFVRPSSPITGPLDGAELAVRIEVEIEWFGEPATVRVRGVVHDTEWEAVVELRPGRNGVKAEALLGDPPLWWPLGYGRPDRVRASAELEWNGERLDGRERRTGLRTTELVQEPRPGGTTSFRFRCSGRDLFITGLNWTPLDAIFARVTPEQITRTLELLGGIECNMLRVWGGGVYEPRHFYDECDRLGILVWQDFMMACGWYPQTEACAAALEAEARQVVRDLRPHPCIALWAGDNECDAFEPDLAPRNRLTRDTLARVCRDLHPQVPYLPSSPYSPENPDPQDEREGDMHFYAHGENYRESRMWELRPRFMSEFGHLSLPSMDVIRRYFPVGTEWPLTHEMWHYHGTDTIRSGRFRWTDCVLKSLAACGRPEPACLEDAVLASQELQSEAMIALIERYASDPGFDGFLVWNVGDCWPQMSDSVTDYLGRPKRIFPRLADVFRTVRREHERAGRPAN